MASARRIVRFLEIKQYSELLRCCGMGEFVVVKAKRIDKAPRAARDSSEVARE